MLSRIIKFVSVNKRDIIFGLRVYAIVMVFMSISFSLVYMMLPYKQFTRICHTPNSRLTNVLVFHNISCFLADTGSNREIK